MCATETDNIPTPRRRRSDADPDIYYFHGTAKSNLQSILKRGLKASKSGGTWDRSKTGSVYVSENRIDARTWAHDASYKRAKGSIADTPVVLKLDIPEDAVYGFERDHSSQQFRRYAHPGDIKPEWIVGYAELTRDGWVERTIDRASK